MSFFVFHVAVALLFAFIFTKSYDFTVCLERIQLDDYWVSTIAIYGISPYAVIKVDGVTKITTAYGDSQEVVYGASEYCVQVNENSVYTVVLWESEYLDDDRICDGDDTINAAVDLGLNAHVCTDTQGHTNYFDFYVEQNAVAAAAVAVTIDNVEYEGDAMNIYVGGETLPSCKVKCENDNNCNYLSYGLFGVNTINMCTMYTSYDSAIKNENAVSVSYMCTVSNLDNLGSGACTSTTGYNTAECGWDGGDCCMATNPTLSNNDNCFDSLNQDIPTPFTTQPPQQQPTQRPTQRPTQQTTQQTITTNVSLSAYNVKLCEYISNYTNFYFEWIGNGICDVGYTYIYYDYSTTINDVICNWDGGDCCMETNSLLSNDANCLDPQYVGNYHWQSSTTYGSKSSNGGYKSSNAAMASIIAIAVIVCIGGVVLCVAGFLYMKRSKTERIVTSNLDYQQMEDVETTNITQL